MQSDLCWNNPLNDIKHRLTFFRKIFNIRLKILFYLEYLVGGKLSPQSV